MSQEPRLQAGEGDGAEEAEEAEGAAAAPSLRSYFSPPSLRENGLKTLKSSFSPMCKGPP